MELGQRWCDNATCRDYGRVGAGNIKVFSHVERRLYCATCRRTFSADKHTSFETLRCPRATVLEALALLAERAARAGRAPVDVHHAAIAPVRLAMGGPAVLRGKRRPAAAREAAAAGGIATTPARRAGAGATAEPTRAQVRVREADEVEQG